VLKLKTRAQFQAVMAGSVPAKTRHFVLHRLNVPDALAASDPMAAETLIAQGPGADRSKALFVLGGGSRAVWLGAVVPKRWAKRAVTRSTIKRQIYTVAQEFELFRQTQPAASMAFVVRLRQVFDRETFVSASSEPLKRAIRAELQALLGRASP
jgi:ribonuclease P protein component